MCSTVTLGQACDCYAVVVMGETIGHVPNSNLTCISSLSGLKALAGAMLMSINLESNIRTYSEVIIIKLRAFFGS